VQNTPNKSLEVSFQLRGCYLSRQ